MVHLTRRCALWLGFLAASTLVPWVGAVHAQSDDGAVFGFVTELSGPASLFGEAGLQAAQLAVDEVNAAGGVLGKPLQMKVADDATDPSTARASRSSSTKASTP